MNSDWKRSICVATVLFCAITSQAFGLPGREYVAVEKMPVRGAKNAFLVLPEMDPLSSRAPSSLPVRHMPVGMAAVAASPAFEPQTVGVLSFAGKRHRVTGVPYDACGFPIFDAKFSVRLKPAIWRAGRSKHYQAANRALKEAIQRADVQALSSFDGAERNRIIGFLSQKNNLRKAPPGYRWHHNQENGLMELVDAKTHRRTKPHIGGNKIWGTSPDPAFYRKVALQWTWVALIDFSISLFQEYETGNLNTVAVLKHGTGVAASGASAWAVRGLLEWYSATTAGGPAIVSAFITYIGVRLVTDACWDKYLAVQRVRQERACRKAETRARWRKLQGKLRTNELALEATMYEGRH